MTEQATRVKIRVGVFVLVAILLFVVFVLTMGSRSQWLVDRYPLHASFRSVEGMMVGAQVRLAGVTVGQVSAIGFGRDPADKRVTVDLSVDRRFQGRIREDSVATISTIGVVGDKYVELTVGSPDRKVLEPETVLASLDGPGIARMLQQGDQIVSNVNRVAADLTQSTADLKRVTGKLAHGEGTLGALLNDPSLYEELSNLVRGTERSWILRTLIRSSVRQGESARS